MGGVDVVGWNGMEWRELDVDGKGMGKGWIAKGWMDGLQRDGGMVGWMDGLMNCKGSGVKGIVCMYICKKGVKWRELDFMDVELNFVNVRRGYV